MVHLGSALAVGLLGLTAAVSAHPGHNHRAEAAERRAFLDNASVHQRSLSKCTNKLKARGHENTNVMRRSNLVKAIRRRRGLEQTAHFLNARSLDSVLATDHNSTLTGVSASTDPSVLFGSNATCILGPDVTQGPYYVTGELIRKNIVEDQEGVPLYMDIQLINTNTCEPLEGIYTDLWHCNSTGVYSGIVSSGNGDSSDASNLDTTWLRGIQPSDKNGVVYMESIFPGHYTSRATHIHVLTHPVNETVVQANGTISGLYSSSSSHVGQLFFDQDLITEVEKTAPYSTNTQELTTNAKDSILSEEADTIDPFMEYVYLGNSVSDGIFAWISIGLDPTTDTTVTPAAYYTEQGGVENESSGSGMGGGGSAPSGTSSGSRPTSF
ncbi:Intradiol ring-cleavage dioxygenase, core [Penicillium expansum]|uniref:Intradiol ring-cleavage dioxygenase, core n=1 Tax=Penicillium expansum TaxID=27334 RepID=A0A0A2KZ65_PENEN|nr:Intradiol ring-cleavage dioxygenase, core [Penicillium expansum]KGO45757.1 Intradiol ring-cleavage dioxygenase, core [Penicillium expansum]KGO57973.1 Intradiol ring-cleavage dioxygenase, core [Penicillium expansum]KGO72218.1 Intradiol ring-cleavage dioxygenase, core [Penicillium expansum]